MKPYYKRGGFFDRLDSFSRWIDYMLEAYGIMYFIPGFRKIAVAKFWVDEAVFDLEIARHDLEEARQNYNKVKCFWMKEL